MRSRILAAGLVLALLGILLSRDTGRSAATPTLPGPPAGEDVVGPSRALESADTPPDVLRDPFRYAEPAAPPRALPVITSPETTLPPAAPSPPSAVRLVGLVRHGASLKAALAVGGEVVVLGVGEEAGGYTLLSVDEEAGVRVRSRDGAEIGLTPP